MRRPLVLECGILRFPLVVHISIPRFSVCCTTYEERSVLAVFSKLERPRVGRERENTSQTRCLRLKNPTQLPPTTRHHQQQHHQTYNSNNTTKTQCPSHLPKCCNDELPGLRRRRRLWKSHMSGSWTREAMFLLFSDHCSEWLRFLHLSQIHSNRLPIFGLVFLLSFESLSSSCSGPCVLALCSYSESLAPLNVLLCINFFHASSSVFNPVI